ncbi:SGNH hydrolase-type esterase domain-containing protein [Triangularia verruculosa]|uniref:SGNH hydrolase-type esterase domain-containing protein n=1 Tax=Triangularia verruculosa TaxID=2587418 RepID=A0AAN7AYS0_9PEZI|nr:SGNH hydrolase-type esterase domain-containing protein [Triangularia verruculosa]
MEPPPPSSTSPNLEALNKIAKYKLRSFETSLNSHIPLIESLTAPTFPDVVLIGDSMIERMLTTARCGPNLVSPWPSNEMLADGDDEQLPSGQVLNLGVGGDRIQNVASRLIGDQAQGLRSVAKMLAEQKSVKLWVLHVGTNNLSPKKGLEDKDVPALKVLIEALLEIGRVGCKVLVTGLFLRKDIAGDKIEEANDKILRVIGSINDGMPGTVVWLPATEEVKEDHLADHVHLTEEGYKLWIGRSLAKEVMILIKCIDGE